MSGIDFAKMIESVLAEKQISKGEFYDATGISATAMYGWKRGAEPKLETIRTVEQYLGVRFSDYEDDPREELRSDLRILLHSARDLPPSSVYALISKIEKMKEDGIND